MKIISTSYINNKYLEISMETVTMSRKEYESLSANEPFRYKKNVLKWMGGKSLTEEKIS